MKKKRALEPPATLFPEWYAEQLAKQAEDNRPERLKLMHRMYGRNPAHTCKGCKHIRRKHHDKVYIKCGLYKDSNGAATDWRLKWEACGKWEME